MANLKEVRNRIASVSSTQQITKAMKMVSAAKLRRAQNAIVQMRPYSQKLGEILANVSGNLDEGSNNQFGQSCETINKVLLIVVTSDRGLCGGFNSNIVKATRSLLAKEYKAQESAGNVDMLFIGKKAYELFSKRDNVNSDFVGSFQNLSFDKIKGAAEFAMDGFSEGKYDRVDIIYNEFKNVATQIVRTEQFLPIVESKSEGEEVTTSNVDYIFEPSIDFILQELIPKSLKIQLYKAVLESAAGEHGARMAAMDKATENAGDLLKDLKLTYNRTRQAAITTEILEIVGGAEALEQG